jgi:hypothetical protein
MNSAARSSAPDVNSSSESRKSRYLPRAILAPLLREKDRSWFTSFTTTSRSIRSRYRPATLTVSSVDALSTTTTW